MDQRPSTGPEGFVAWLEGIPCSGKTTAAHSVAERLRAVGWKVEILDGDEVRQMFSPDLGFSRKDREVNARRVAYVARLLARNGVAVLVALITPYETSRQTARAIVGDRFTEIWLRCPVEVCRQRDPKGLYRGSAVRSGSKLTGVDDPFEEPLNPDLTVDTAAESVAEETWRILEHLAQQGFARRVLAA
jgi:adenylylsulfate kinase